MSERHVLLFYAPALVLLLLLTVLSRKEMKQCSVAGVKTNSPMEKIKVDLYCVVQDTFFVSLLQIAMYTNPDFPLYTFGTRWFGRLKLYFMLYILADAAVRHFLQQTLFFFVQKSKSSQKSTNTAVLLSTTTCPPFS